MTGQAQHLCISRPLSQLCQGKERWGIMKSWWNMNAWWHRFTSMECTSILCWSCTVSYMLRWTWGGKKITSCNISCCTLWSKQSHHSLVLIEWKQTSHGGISFFNRTGMRVCAFCSSLKNHLLRLSNWLKNHLQQQKKSPLKPTSCPWISVLWLLLLLPQTNVHLTESPSNEKQT